MKTDIKTFLEKIKNNEKFNKKMKKITIVLSLIVAIVTLYVLTFPAITLNTVGEYKLSLNDSLVNDSYSWKNENGYITSFNLKLTYSDTEGNLFDGKNIDVNISSDAINHGFTFGATKNDIIDLLKENEIETINTDNGKYIFEHAEVFVNETWQTLSLNELTLSKIWCKNCLSEAEPEDKQYGWYGSFGDDSTEFLINDSTEYKLVYKFEENVEVKKEETKKTTLKATKSTLLSNEYSIPSLGSESGIDFKLYNYSGSNGEEGVNNNGLYNYFTFKDAHNTKYPIKTNDELDGDGFSANHVKVKRILDKNGNPVFDCQGKCGSLNTSLGYLFGQPTNAKGTATEGVESYNPNNTILKKENKNGIDYYTYDSNKNAVDYDIANKRFILREYIERGYLTTTFAGENDRGEFLPFNYLVNASNKNVLYAGDASGRYNYESANSKDEIDHWFGMTMEFEFYMPKDGLINADEHMIFSFTGDDDVWVFIDDVLVLDLGGTHGAVDGTIDFNTGKINTHLNWGGDTGSVAAGTATNTSISEMYQKAGRTFEANEDGSTYADYTKHTLKFFYLERGAWVANCKINFNIPVLPSGSVSVKKEFEGTEKHADDYKFVIYDVTTGSVVPKGTKYTIGGIEYEIDNNNGEFILKNNEVATFLSKTSEDDPNGVYLRSGNQYYVRESDSGRYSTIHSCSFGSIGCLDKSQTNNFKIEPSSKHFATFTNKMNTYNLKISKEAINSYEGEKFDFKVTMKDESNNVVDISDFTITSPNGYTIDSNNKGLLKFQLETNQTITINNIPIETIIVIQEIDHDGYHVSMKSVEANGKEIPLVQGDKYTINKISENKDIKVYNTPGVELPETGSIGTLIYIVIGLGVVMASAILSIAYFRKAKVGDQINN